VLACAVIAILGLSAAGLLRFGAQIPDDGSLAARGRLNNNILQKKDQTPDNALAQNAEKDAPLVMPADVEEWLKHLEKTEEMKNDLTMKQIADMKVFEQMFSVLGPAMGEVDPYDQSGEAGQHPADLTKGKFEDLRPQWQEVLAFFTSKQPPAECEPIAASYYRALNEIPGMIGDINEVLNGVSANPSGAMQEISKMKNKSYGGIDKNLAETDERVQGICTKYNKKKWFNVKSDVLGGGMLGKAGF